MSWYPDDNDLTALRRLLVLAHRSGSWISIPNLCTGRTGGADNSSRIKLPRGDGDAAGSDVAHVVDSAARLLAPEALRVLVRESIRHAPNRGSAGEDLPLESVACLLRAASQSASGREIVDEKSTVTESDSFDELWPRELQSSPGKDGSLLSEEDVQFYTRWLELGRSNRQGGDGCIDKGWWLQEL